MKTKKLTALATAILATVICCSAFSFASATEANYAQTRYRFPIAKFELPVFRTGVSIDDASNTKRVSSDGKKSNGPDNLFLATYEKYDFLGSTNKALRIRSEHKNLTAAERYTGFSFKPNADIGSSKSPLEGKTGIPQNASDHGVMLHFSSNGLNGKPGFMYYEQKTDGTEGYKIEYYERDFNFTMQEIDYNNDGTPRVGTDDDGEQKKLTTALNTGDDHDITLIWTIDFAHEWEETADGETTKQSVDAKVGTVQVIKSKGGSIKLPRGFCGYVVIPFSSMDLTWDSSNENGLLDMKDVELANLYMGLYPHFEGDVWIDDYFFYGPTFADVKGAIDMGAGMDIKNFATNKGVAVGTGGTTGGNTDVTSGGSGGGTSDSSSGGSANTGDSGVVWALWVLFGASTMSGIVIALKKKKA